MRLVFHEHAGPFERFDVGAFQTSVGRTIRLILEDGSVTHAYIEAAEVAPCGGVDLVLDVAPWN